MHKLSKWGVSKYKKGAPATRDEITEAGEASETDVGSGNEPVSRKVNGISHDLPLIDHPQ